MDMKEPGFAPQPFGELCGRKLELFSAPSCPAWGYAEPQTDSFAVIHPEKTAAGARYPLYVVFHSAGHDLYSALACTWQAHNHDIYKTPSGMFGLYLDCRRNEAQDWWWGGNSAKGAVRPGRDGLDLQPVEHRVMDTIAWVMKHYPIDPERVYAVGNSMGGSGALGIAMRRGDVFAAVAVNVPAGCAHIADRLGFDGTPPSDLPEPPVLVDYSAQNDAWSAGHERLYRGMRARRYALIGYFGCFGHENDHEKIRAVNDLFDAFDITTLRRSDPYPAFTNATTDDPIPWGEGGEILHDRPGQVNAFFRWAEAAETENSASLTLRLVSAAECKTRVALPREATADLTLRRLSRFRVAAGEHLFYEYGDRRGSVVADRDGHITLPAVSVTVTPTVLRVFRKEESDASNSDTDRR